MHLTDFEKQIYLTALSRGLDHTLNRGRVNRAAFAHRSVEMAREVVLEHRLQLRIARARKKARQVRKVRR